MKQFLETRRSLLVWSTFGLILVVAGLFRFQALDWDQGQWFHPDERAIVTAVQNLNTIVTSGDPRDQYAPRRNVSYPFGGLGFFIPNGTDIRPATPEETKLYQSAGGTNGSYKLPPNVVPPDQPPPDKAVNFWNAAYSPSNPHFFAYGSFPMYIIRAVADVTSAIGGPEWNTYGKLIIIGRFLSVLWSLGTIVLVFLLGPRLFGPSLGRAKGQAIGLLAAAFLAVSVLDIQLAHYLAFDVPTTFFLTLTVYFAVGHMRSGTRRSAILTGLGIGLSLACKISAGPIALVGIVAALLYGLYGSAKFSGETANRPSVQPLANEEGRYPGAALGRRLLGGTLLNLVIMGAVALVAWFLTMPYAFIDFPEWSSRVLVEFGMSRGINDFPYTRQYIGSSPFLYQASNLVQWGLGWPLGLLAIVGFLLGLWRIIRRRIKAEILIYCWLLPYMLMTFSGEVKFNRYILPALPLLLLLAARFAIADLRLPIKLLKFSSTRQKPEIANTFFTTEDTEVSQFPTQNSKLKTQNFLPTTDHRPPTTFLTLGTVLAIIAFVWAGVWAVAFSQIYSKDHPMNLASRWMYDNMPVGASYSTETWDEGMPRQGYSNLDYGSKGWRNVPMDIYGDQPNEEKARYFADVIKQTDYIVISSNRLYATMPKLPWRYPVQIRFYELLFSGNLGYQQVATFTDYPTVPLLNWQINDQSADESFTVYDHPKVMIFKKTEQFSEAQYQGLFANAVKAPQVVKRVVTQADLPTKRVTEGDGALDSTTAGQYNYYDEKDGKKINNAKSLLLDKPVDQLPAVEDWAWFGFANQNQWLAVIIWYILAQVLGLVSLPIVLRVCRRLPDRAYILAKPIGGMLIALVIWLLVWTRQFMNTVSTAYIALALVGAFSLWLFSRHRTEMLFWLKANRRLIVCEEAILLVAYLVWIGVRLVNPDLWHPFFGGEKPMEFTHLNGILRSPYFPPYDPWFSDGYINYYYYGQYLVATWIKLTGIDAGIAFNLALPLLYGFVCVGGFSLVYNLASNFKRRQSDNAGNISQGGPIFAGLFGVFVFAVAGNFDGFIQLIQRLQPVVDLANRLKIYPDTVVVPSKFDYFRSSRVIGGTNITEFPFFSFLYGDLHAHLINLPYTLVALSLALNLISTDWVGHDETRRNPARRITMRLWRVFDSTLLTPILLAALLGFLAATNIWDLPTYFGVLTLAFFLALFRRPSQAVKSEAESEKLRPRFNLPNLVTDAVLAGIVMAGILVLGYLLYWNFFSHYQALYGEVAATRSRSPFLYWLVVFILPLFVLVSYLIWSFKQWLINPERAILRPSPLRPDSSYAPDFEENEEELDELEDVPAPTLQPRPNFSLQLRRPELALSFAGAGAGADGGSNEGVNFGSGNGPNSGGSRLNLFALPWVVIMLAAFGSILTVALVDAKQLVFVVGLLMTLGAAMLVVFRSFDPNPTQAAEARQPQNLFVRLLIATAFAVVAGVEIVYLVDDLSGSDDLYRMNTIFKFYYQVWTMLTLAAAFAAYVLWTRWIAPKSRLFATTLGGQIRGIIGRFFWLAALTLLVLGVSVYTFLAPPGKWAERSSSPLPPLTLDGRAYFDALREVRGMPNMEDGKSFDMLYEAKSLREFYDKISGSPVVMQSSIWPYRGGGSWIAINTGLPIVLGWDHHETQQRYYSEVERRGQEGALKGCVREFYNTGDITHALEILNHYHVTYVHLGVIERDGSIRGHAGYINGPDENCLTSPMINVDPGGAYEPLMSEEGFGKFDKMVQLGLLQVAYQNPGVTVYKLTTKGMAGVVEGADNLPVTPKPTASDPKLSRLLDSVNRNPNNAQARYDLSQYYLQKRDLEKAAEQMQMVTELKPTDVNPFHVLGDIYLMLGQKDKALEAWKQPTIFAPTVPAAFNKYGIGLYGENRYQEALDQFKKTIQLNPRFEEAYYHSGECYEALNRPQDALQAYQQTANAAQEPDSFWVKKANQKVQALLGKK